MAFDVEGVPHSEHLIELTAIEMLVRQRYGMDHFNGNITRRDLTTPTPYNTYTRHGLPPGPIASPGAKSLLAAVSPAHSDYLYFVSRKDKTHQFSRTWEEHLQAVGRYQLGGD